MKKTILSLAALTSCGIIVAGLNNNDNVFKYYPAELVTESPQLKAPQGENIVLLSSLDLTKCVCGDNRTMKKDLSSDGQTLSIAGVTYDNGVGAHGPSKIIVKTNCAAKFNAMLGVDDEAAEKADHGIADYTITGRKADGSTVSYKSGTIQRGEAAVVVNLDIADIDYLILETTNGAGQNWADHIDWADAYFTLTSTESRPITVTESEMESGTETPTIYPPSKPSTPGLNAIALLGDMDLYKSTTGWAGHETQNDLSIDGNPITLKDTVYVSGAGAHASNEIIVKLNGAARFVSNVGIDDEVKKDSRPLDNRGICKYYVKGVGGKADATLAEGVIKATDTASKKVDVNCDGYTYLILGFDSEGGSANDSDHGDWANAYFEHSGNNDIPPYVVSADEISSRLACATTVFSQPGVKFMHRLKAANSDATLSVSKLPAGLTFNEKRQLVEGVINEEGVYHYTVTVTTTEETKEEEITLTVSSSLIQPVPFMGWISWNTFEGNVSESNVLGVANAFVDLGLNKYGYRYICLDDLWHASGRAADGKPQYDSTKFPNGLRNLTDKIHGLDMRLGIYSDAAGSTCAGAYGSLGFEKVDAQQYADWGFDLLKYDACGTNGLNSAQLASRYKTMGDALKATNREILFYMCEWGSRNPWLWGAESGGSCWRVSYDSRDIWDHGQHDGGHCGVIQGIDIMSDVSYYGGVNRYNDGDMMMIGLWGTGKSSNANGASGMTATEYQSQFSMWCMFASPLTLCNDVRFWSNPTTLTSSGLSTTKQKLISDNKEHDLAMITNEEMLAIDQDRMGQSAHLIKKEGNLEYYAKDLENGDIAIAVLNRGTSAATATINLADYDALEQGKEYAVRDLWAHEYLENTATSFSVSVAKHETKVYRIIPAENTGIGQIATDVEVPAVKATDDKVLIRFAQGNNSSKRILISDLKGNILAQTTTTDASVAIPFDSAKSVYIANCVIDGRAFNVKFVK